jgi:hypothetical protein
MLGKIIFRPLSEHRALLAHARILMYRSRKLLKERFASTFVGTRHGDPVPADPGQDVNAEAEATANKPSIERETVNELIRLTDELLRRYGLDIEAENGMIRCLVISEFVIATHTVQPDLAVYRILQHDNEENISPLFVATMHSGSGAPDLRLYRNGPWERNFWNFTAEVVDWAPSQHLH